MLNEIIGKKLSLGLVENVARLCKQLAIQLSAYYIIGFPGETEADIQKTLAFAFKLDAEYNVYPYINYAIPFLGTRLHALCEEKGFLVKEVNAQSLLETTHFRSKGLIRTEEFKPEKLQKMLAAFHRRFVKNHLIKAVTDPQTFMREARMALKNRQISRRILIGR